MILKKIISGGQSGVDRAALDAAIANNIPHGGWCPKGRLAEQNTTIPKKYLLNETHTVDVNVRTKLNIQDSCGTLIILPKWPLNIKDGTSFTLDEVNEQAKPFFIINLSGDIVINDIISWLKSNNISILNIAGPRESSSPGIYKQTFLFLKNFFNIVSEILLNEEKLFQLKI